MEAHFRASWQTIAKKAISNISQPFHTIETVLYSHVIVLLEMRKTRKELIYDSIFEYRIASVSGHGRGRPKMEVWMRASFGISVSTRKWMSRPFHGRERLFPRNSKTYFK